MPIQHQVVRLSALGLMALGLQGTSWSATISGKVTAGDGRPVSGALVTVFNAERSRKETVYTAPDGSYVNTVDFSGTVTVRARLPYFEDVTKEVLVAADKPVSADFVLSKITDPQTLSDSLTASAHLTRVQWKDPVMRDAFVNNCNSCHQLGNATTRIQRDEAGWTTTIQKMEFFAVLTNAQQKGIAKALTAGMDGKPVRAIQTYDVGPQLRNAKVHEWLVGDGVSFIHDAIVGQDGKLYGSDEGHDVIWVLDRTTHKIEKYPEPDIDLPKGGLFSGMPFPIGSFEGKHGPHSMAQTSDGLIWITNALSSTLMSFNPKTKAFKTYEVGRTHLYPHTIRVDKKDVIWFTCMVSNEVVRFDPRTEKFTVIGLPHNGFWRAMADIFTPYALKIAAWFPGHNLHNELGAHKRFGVDHKEIMNAPYGIDINPVDGSVWYGKVYADKIGRIDPVTLEVVEYDTPLKGPRRPRFDRNGILWIPAFGDSGLMAFNPKTAVFQTYKLPLLAPNEYEVPYALNVHPKTGNIWITSNMSDRSFIFDPKSKSFSTYPSPTRVTWMRDWEFTTDGQGCSSNSNLPAYAIEDGVDSFVCIDLEGGARDRQQAGRK